jgi:hypothetical protein
VFSAIIVWQDSSLEANMLHDRAAHRCTVCCTAAIPSTIAVVPNAILTAAVVGIMTAVAAIAGAAHAGQVRQQLLE